MGEAGAAEAARDMADPWGTFVTWLLHFFPDGPVRPLLIVAAGLCPLIAAAVYFYFYGLLGQGAAAEDSIADSDEAARV
jgi:hypothetical protein